MSKIRHFKTVRRWHEAGYTYQEIADRYAEKFGDRFTRGAFRDLSYREGWPSRLIRLPWKVRREHVGTYHYKVACSALRVEAGLPVKRYLRERLRAFQRQWGTDVVIDYRPQDGFMLVDRRPGEKGLVRTCFLPEGKP